MFIVRRVGSRSVQVKLVVNQAGDQRDFILMRFGINRGLHVQGQNGHGRRLWWVGGQIDVAGEVDDGLEFAPCGGWVAIK